METGGLDVGELGCGLLSRDDGRRRGIPAGGLGTQTHGLPQLGEEALARPARSVAGTALKGT